MTSIFIIIYFWKMLYMCDNGKNDVISNHNSQTFQTIFFSNILFFLNKGDKAELINLI